MSTLQLPTVTEQDLLQYHASHHGGPFPHAQLMISSQAPSDPTMDEDDDGLGYYSDGTKRTLTPLQVAMFRHTEIETILHERREAAEKEARLASRSATPAQRPTRPGSRGDDEDEREYARFLAAERKEFEIAAAQKRNGERAGYEYDPRDRTISTRRKVREMDSMRTTEDVLMYDDEPVAPVKKDDAVETQGKKEKEVEGRKVWFPMIG